MSGRSNREALIRAIIPAPGSALPALEDLDLASFWSRFDDAGPAHLRLGLQVAAFTLVQIAPRLLGHARPLSSMDDCERDAVLQRAARLPLASDLLEVAKIVACMAYFDDDHVQALVRKGAGR